MIGRIKKSRLHFILKCLNQRILRVKYFEVGFDRKVIELQKEISDLFNHYWSLDEFKGLFELVKNKIPKKNFLEIATEYQSDPRCLYDCGKWIIEDLISVLATAVLKYPQIITDILKNLKDEREKLEKAIEKAIEEEEINGLKI